MATASSTETQQLHAQNTGVGTVPLIGGLGSMRYLGVTSQGVDYPNPQLPNATWRRDNNGNPSNMLSLVRSVILDDTVLFLIERDLNRNVVVYRANINEDTGAPDATNPVTVFWLMIPGTPSKVDQVAENSDEEDDDEELDMGDMYTEDLNTVEKTVAYGVDSRVVGGKVKLYVKALRGESITLEKQDGTWHGTMNMAGESMRIERVLVSTEPRTWGMWPTITESHMELREPTGRLNTYHYHT